MKHFTTDKEPPGPDHSASLEPNDLKQMIKSIHNINEALGDGIKIPSNSELKNISTVRKSIVANKKIKKGELFSTENLSVKRPGTGISPMHWDNIIGKISNFDFLPDEIIKL